jgi:hypothetical protein
MKRFLLAVSVLLLVCGPAYAGGGLEAFLDNLNVQASTDLPGFSARISAQFGVPLPQVQAVLGSVAVPADAFMIFQLGQMANRPLDLVLRNYHSNRGRGWGVIAKSLGIKPGSAEFHALKRGDFVLTGGSGEGNYKMKGKGKGHKK